ncbi:Ankyrin repeat protein B18 [Varanus komodoensis]|nr:Ankyrin repeat protein B18 [Varanus komodoensis]
MLPTWHSASVGWPQQREKHRSAALPPVNITRTCAGAERMSQQCRSVAGVRMHKNTQAKERRSASCLLEGGVPWWDAAYVLAEMACVSKQIQPAVQRSPCCVLLRRPSIAVAAAKRDKEHLAHKGSRGALLEGALTSLYIKHFYVMTGVLLAIHGQNFFHFATGSLPFSTSLRVFTLPKVNLIALCKLEGCQPMLPFINKSPFPIPFPSHWFSWSSDAASWFSARNDALPLLLLQLRPVHFSRQFGPSVSGSQKQL